MCPQAPCEPYEHMSKLRKLTHAGGNLSLYVPPCPIRTNTRPYGVTLSNWCRISHVCITNIILIKSSVKVTICVTVVDLLTLTLFKHCLQTIYSNCAVLQESTGASLAVVQAALRPPRGPSRCVYRQVTMKHPEGRCVCLLHHPYTPGDGMEPFQKTLISSDWPHDKWWA